MTARAAARREAPTADVFARTVPFIYERHSFGEHKKASMADVEVRRTEEQSEADKSLLALRKRVIQMPETAAIRHRDTRFREFLQGVSTPFRPGFYLVPVGLVERVHAEARRWETERGQLADAAKAAYPAQLEKMRAPLGPLFNPLDYPSPDRFRGQYWVEWRFVDFGVPNVLREIRAEVFEEERAKLARTGAKAREMIEQHLAGSLLKITDHLALLLKPRAGGKLPALREGAMDKLMQFLDTAALRDVTDFKQLQAVTNRLRQVTKGIDVEQLRDDDELRTRTATAIEAAKAQIEKLVTEETRRAIILRDAEEVA